MSGHAHTILPHEFETLYLQLRQQEGRLYTDEELLRLPAIDRTHYHYREWQIRKRSAQKLISYLRRKKKPLAILEPGCGNGWLCHQLSTIRGCTVMGTDINRTEIKQAGRVFRDLPNLRFLAATIGDERLQDKRFDIIVFAACIQYFRSLKEVIEQAKHLLNPGGEIHILDSPFYSTQQLEGARQRSLHYYEKAGFPELSNHYFHHSTDELGQYPVSILYDPKKLVNRLSLIHHPFYWFRLQ